MRQEVRELILAGLSSRRANLKSQSRTPKATLDLETALRVLMTSDLKRIEQQEPPSPGYDERLSTIAAAASWSDLRLIDALNLHWEAWKTAAPFEAVYAHALDKMLA